MSKVGGDRMNQRSSVDFVDLLLEDVVNRDVSPETRADLYSLPKTRYDQTHERMRKAVSRTPEGSVVTVAVEVTVVEGMIEESVEHELLTEDARMLFWAAASRDLVQEITGLDRRRLTKIRESMEIQPKKRSDRTLRPTAMEQRDIVEAWLRLDEHLRRVRRLVLVAQETRFHVAMVWAAVRRRAL